MNHQRYIDQLLRKITSRWPVREEEAYQLQIRVCRAFRESDRSALQPDGWNSDSERDRAYVVDPLGERIPYVWSDLLFGADPVVSPVSKSDADKMDQLLNYNKMSSELQRAEWICSSEGEVWYRIAPDHALGHACIEWHSRATVTPLWIGRHLMGAAFVSVLEYDTEAKEIYRYVEIHAKGLVQRHVFVGKENTNSLGEEIPLTERPETADWERVWEHGGDILCERIPNKLGADWRMGISDYDGIEDLMLALNELTTIGQENARLTAKQRAILPQRFLDQQGNLPRGAEILIATEVDQDPEKIKNQVAMVEFSFDAAALIAYTEHITDRILTRARVAPQLVGRHTEGAQTGPALRARVLDSVLAAQGKGKYWDDEMPLLLNKAVSVEKLPTSNEGFGIAWTVEDDKLPSFKRSSSLPEDPEALSRRLAIEVNAEFLSRKTAIQMSHPEWDATRVEDEVKQIMKEVGNGIEAPTAAFGKPPAAPTSGAIPITNSPETGGAKQERSNGGVKARAN